MNQSLLQDRVAVVTGAGQGIGREIARVLAEHGARVVLADVNETEANSPSPSFLVSNSACPWEGDLGYLLLFHALQCRAGFTGFVSGVDAPGEHSQ